MSTCELTYTIERQSTLPAWPTHQPRGEEPIFAILHNTCTQLTDSKVSGEAYSILMQRSSCYGQREELHLQRESVKQERQSGIAFSPHCTQLEYLNQHSPHSRDLYFTFRLPPYRFNFPIVVVVVITTSGLDRQIII